MILLADIVFLSVEQIYPYAIRRNDDCPIGMDFNNRLSLRIAFFNLVVRFMKEIEDVIDYPV